MKINKAIKTLKKFAYWHRSNEDIGEDTINSIDTVLDALRWRSVEEELPEYGERVLIYPKNNLPQIAWRMHNEYFQSVIADYIFEGIAGWLPIPRKEEE